jgi:hypothetical protein
MKTKHLIFASLVALLFSCKIEEDIKSPLAYLDCSHERSFATFTINGETTLETGDFAEVMTNYGFRSDNGTFQLTYFYYKQPLNRLIVLNLDEELHVGTYSCEDFNWISVSIRGHNDISESYVIDCDKPFEFQVFEADLKEGVLCFHISGFFKEAVFNRATDDYTVKENGKTLKLENGRLSVKGLFSKPR